jgi:hypothetical protein
VSRKITLLVTSVSVRLKILISIIFKIKCVLLISAVFSVLQLTKLKKKPFDGLTSVQFTMKSVGDVATLGVIATTHTT